MIQWWFHFVFLWLAVFQPLLTWLRRKRFRRGTSNLDTRRLYLRVIVGQWVLALGVVFVFWKLGIPLGALGLVAPQWIPTASLFAALVVAVFLGTRRLRAVLNDPEKLAKIRARAAGFSQLVPMTDEEERWWIMVSITAGVCEEILYRGYLGFYLGRSMPLPLVAVVASVLFGLAHIYQGSNAWRTLFAAALLWATYLATGSILPGMVLHALIDVRSGRALRRAFTEPAPIAAPVP